MRFLKLLLTWDIVIPLVGLIVYGLIVFSLKGTFPSGQELVENFGAIYARYGYKILFLSALLETLVLVNFLIPGQLAMVLGIVFARTGQINLEMVVAMIVLGACLGYFIDYCLGWFGFQELLKKLNLEQYVVKTEKQIKKWGAKALVLGFIHANVGTFTSLAAGVIQINVWRFMMIAILSTLFWTSAWSLLIYTFGDIFINLFTRYTPLVLVIFLGVVVLLKLFNGEKNKS
ncbi:hypothetical protein A2631_00150 [Candidatus Daviesbacteria bacterium RIFCSPHIGHO2_01_FULL_44_29]|uniref:VTT domain-containing protein n=1 Tax=Candidatus Daviesbacteria bacterium RIFCSPHIGHO2_02_FULL_43_12 TaxID=1797776 RepID=A0A1F5KIC6_9BACT|nr:MAG: hypothetical protein A2631_00150 [Candidatus Daviesbacteria bacterium RIFCSPHIGHO2_01_FULL_44_29]OGE40555.1 MAG: hypothetical protein A3D25_00345 [Candidatus Daviesbacteria bacterium RIFCSPHIGHO2_02_FULL_43_12]OGE40928.1 MAG: hypothetical protein A3E86_05575 [Candidatus Daviesbacteria bacterium RIFCSPHIGHO2_12_FULL_47_45]OGE70114.1 MAG: hypothetical protein A3B55_00115 [Candidatus Daviesbacteria bacterium RIFCSPLOWO2_01_FULL_43_15]